MVRTDQYGRSRDCSGSCSCAFPNAGAREGSVTRHSVLTEAAALSALAPYYARRGSEHDDAKSDSTVLAARCLRLSASEYEAENHQRSRRWSTSLPSRRQGSSRPHPDRRIRRRRPGHLAERMTRSRRKAAKGESQPPPRRGRLQPRGRAFRMQKESSTSLGAESTATPGGEGARRWRAPLLGLSQYD